MFSSGSGLVMNTYIYWLNTVLCVKIASLFYIKFLMIFVPACIRWDVKLYSLTPVALVQVGSCESFRYDLTVVFTLYITTAFVFSVHLLALEILYWDFCGWYNCDITEIINEQSSQARRNLYIDCLMMVSPLMLLDCCFFGIICVGIIPYQTHLAFIMVVDKVMCYQLICVNGVFAMYY